MNPQTPPNQPTAPDAASQPMPPQPPQANQSAPVQAAPSASVPFYRQYWIFAVIYILLTPIIGLIILLTGEIYRKDKTGQFAPITKREKTTLTVVAILLWIAVVFAQVNAKS